jgi:hypothetical protein
VRAPSSSKTAALREYAPAFMAALIARGGGGAGRKELAAIACDNAEALHDEIELRAEAEARIGRQPGSPGFAPE